MRVLIFSLFLLHAANAVPQLITAKDGQVGVNFGGYEAHANLGGLLSGGPQGFLNAGASTPHGQSASAGLGGHVNGEAKGIAYANAQASPSVRSGVVLSGSTDSAGSADHHISTISNEDHDDRNTVIQKIKPPKKYNLIKPDTTEAPVVEVHRPLRRKHQRRQQQKRRWSTESIETHPASSGNSASESEAASMEHRQHNPNGYKYTDKTIFKTYPTYEHSAQQHDRAPQPGVIHQSLGIPIGILRSLQESLGGGGSAHYKEGKSHENPHIVSQALQIPAGILESLQQSLSGFDHRKH